MLIIETSTFADKAIIEEGTKKLSLIGIFNALKPEIPIVPTLSFCCLLGGSGGTYPLEIRVTAVGPDDAEIQLHNVKLAVQVIEGEKSHLIADFIGLPIMGKALKFGIYLDNSMIHSTSLPIN